MKDNTEAENLYKYAIQKYLYETTILISSLFPVFSLRISGCSANGIKYSTKNSLSFVIYWYYLNLLSKFNPKCCESTFFCFIFYIGPYYFLVRRVSVLVTTEIEDVHFTSSMYYTNKNCMKKILFLKISRFGV